MTRDQDQFLDVIDRDEAERRFHAALRVAPLGEEAIALEVALGRTLSRDVLAAVDVPSFDRSNVDGFAVRASDTFGAREDAPRELRLLDEVISTGYAPRSTIDSGTAATIATGGMLPRGADAVLMVEHADVVADRLLVRRALTAGAGISFAGSDIGRGETVLRRGETLTSRETGVLAALGEARAWVWSKPRVAVISTGDEIIAPGEPMSPAMIYDSNARILADAVRELGGDPISLGIVHDDLAALRERIQTALADCDIVLLSGGTSKGAGDLSYRVVREFHDPGIVAHGVALKPGKPICLAVTHGKPVVILPGFPTSAIFTFHEFVAPVIREFAGRGPERAAELTARLAMKVNSEIGRTEFLLVGLIEAPTAESMPQSVDRSANASDVTERNATSDPAPSLVAYPMGKGSGSVTAFSRADGFVTIGRHEEIVEAGSDVRVRLLGRNLRAADLIVIGSHCVGLDLLLGRLQDQGFRTKFLAVGSTGGLDAARRGECDLAGIHLLDPKTNQYNRPFLTAELELIAGYDRLQGIVFRPGDARFEGCDVSAALRNSLHDPQCVLVNRNQGSGTRILIDRLLGEARPNGYANQSRSHNAVAAAVAQGRADWGVAIQQVATQTNLGFIPLTVERYDFVTPRARSNRPAVRALKTLLTDANVRRELHQLGLLGS